MPKLSLKVKNKGHWRPFALLFFSTYQSDEFGLSTVVNAAAAEQSGGFKGEPWKVVEVRPTSQPTAVICFHHF